MKRTLSTPALTARIVVLTAIAVALTTITGCASLELHLAERGCVITGPLSFTCPWEVRQ